MKSILTIILITITSLVLINCKPNLEKKQITSEKESEWQVLFNGKDLTGWDTYLGMPYEKDQNIWQQKQLHNYKPFGLNNDPLEVFTVVIEDSLPALRLSGEVFGGISTVAEYENYHLQLEFKWGKLKYAPKLDAPRDSGLLYHAVDEQGTEAGFWMRSQEMQIQEHDCGDYWGVAGTQVNVRSEMRTDSVYYYNPKAKHLHFGNASELGRNVKKYPDGEKPYGEWNTIDLYCYGTKSVHIVNGVITMILENSRIIIDSIEKPLTKGKIQLQTEGAELYYRNIKIKPIFEFPSL